MKLRSLLAILFFVFTAVQASKDSCTIELTAKLAQDILDGINIILPKVTVIQKDVEKIIINQASFADLICSKIDSINVSVADVQVSGLDEIENTILSVGDVLCSKIDSINISVADVQVSGLDEIEDAILSVGDVLCSKIDAINVSIADVQVSGLDQLESKIGNLDDEGSCLETLIDVPDDINNLNLTIISLLKTILLELRGCNPNF